jgi:hypothetical protein
MELTCSVAVDDNRTHASWIGRFVHELWTPLHPKVGRAMSSSRHLLIKLIRSVMVDSDESL